jgi:hypothetical protein
MWLSTLGESRIWDSKAWSWVPRNSNPRVSKSKLCYDRRPVDQSVLVSSTHLGPNSTFLLLPDSDGFVDVGRALWRQGGSIVYNCCWYCQGPSPARLMTIFYCLRLKTPPNLQGQVSVFITPRIRVAQLYPPGTGSLFVASYESQGYGGGIRNHLHVGNPSLSKSKLLYYLQFTAKQFILASKPLRAAISVFFSIELLR